MQRTLSVGLLVLGGFVLSAPAEGASEPGWSNRVLKVGQRAEINAIPIEQRPYRPLHFYGNTVRRMHYRGQALPRRTDLSTGVRALVADPNG